MKKNRSILLVILLIASLALCGTVFAYMFRQTEAKNNQFIPAEVSCEVEEAFDGSKKTSITVENKKDSNENTGEIDAYIRVRLVSYWVDENDNIVAEPSKMPTISMADGWVKGPDDTYYYATPVAPGAKTTNLLAAPLVLEEHPDGYIQVVDVFAEAIQWKPQNAVTESWKVTLDVNGNIISAP